MDGPFVYEIRLEGQLSECWSEWLCEMTVQAGEEGETILSGPLPDQAALLGLLYQLQALNLIFLSVRKLGPLVDLAD